MAETLSLFRVRITSKKTYNSGTLFLADIYSMPHGCATWPAYWTVGPDWPNGGEIDILGEFSSSFIVLFSSCGV